MASTKTCRNHYLKRVTKDGEINDSVIKQYLITASDGKKYKTTHYNLQVIISVGFKIENERAVQFRKWARQVVKDYTIQGWTMNTERLKKAHQFDKNLQRKIDYFSIIKVAVFELLCYSDCKNLSKMDLCSKH